MHRAAFFARSGPRNDANSWTMDAPAGEDRNRLAFAVRAPARLVPSGATISTRTCQNPQPAAERGEASPMIVLTEDAILDALRTVQEPELGRDLVTRNMVKDLAIDGGRVAFTIELTTPACPLKDEIEAQRPGGARRRSAPTRSRSPGGRWSAGRRQRRPQQLLPGRQEHHRRRLRQGRRRQEHGQRQPGRRAGPGRRLGRPARRRHHRPEHPADDGRRGPAQGKRRTTRSRRSSATASR